MTLVIGAFTIGFILALLSIGVWISFRVLRFTDITVDGSITLGAAVEVDAWAREKAQELLITKLYKKETI